MFAARLHTHPRNQAEELYGQELSPEDLVESIDMYPNSTGVWKGCESFRGFKAKEVTKTFGMVIRPVAQPRD